MKGARFPLLWVLGLTLGTLGTGFLFDAMTQGSSMDLLIGLALFLPGLYLAGNVLARARRIYRQSAAPRRSRRSQAHG